MPVPEDAAVPGAAVLPRRAGRQGGPRHAHAGEGVQGTHFILMLFMT